MNTSPSEHDPEKPLILEGNLARLIAAADWRSAAAEDWLLRPVVAEVRQQRRKLVRRRVLTVGIASLAATAAMLLVAVFALRNPPRPENSPSIAQPGISPSVAEVARVQGVSGLASLMDGQTPRALAGQESVIPGEWLKTAWGSRAEILLADQSQLLVQSHTHLQINSRIGGKDILLEQGQISLEVTRQPPGKVLTISTPKSQIAVVGTGLDVQVLTRPDGRKQTWVDVRSGRVEFASGGQRVVLLPNMQGVAKEGEPPIVRSQTAELNELTRLIDRVPTLAAEAGIPPGSAAIVEFHSDGSASVWSLVGATNPAQTPRNECFLECNVPDCQLEVFTSRGARLPATLEGEQWRIDCSADPLPPGGQRSLVIKIGNVPGLFAEVGAGVFEFAGPAVQPARLSLLQLRLPASARAEEILPKPIEVRRSLSRLVLTIASCYQLPQVVRQRPR
jgi:ferric-dicitrate binding protein FerR (iron transport regulator)